MSVAADTRRWIFHPCHAFLVAAAFPLFLGALLADIAYGRTYEIQWTNFASWLLAGGMLFAGAALACALVALFRPGRDGATFVHFLVVLAMFAVGLIDSFVHARDGWATMPASLWLSGVVVVLAAWASWSAFAGVRRGVAP